MKTTQLLNLRLVSAHLSAIQNDIEDSPNIYSEKTWGLVADALSIVDSLEESIHFEETTTPAER